MTVPLDRLYHYIESVARDIRGDDVVIYRFSPHGSKKIEDLKKLKKYSALQYTTSPHIYCNDQEPLNYEYYNNTGVLEHPDAMGKKLLHSLGIDVSKSNFHLVLTMFDKVLLLHSEERSINLVKYQAGPFIPVYYWSHAVISLEWFRYAQHIDQNKQVTKRFLIYNRAWSGTREYRLKFTDLLVSNNLHTSCLMAFNAVDPESNIHYTNHTFINTAWTPKNKLENYFDKNISASSASADFVVEDYEATDFEVVLETLFDDDRLHLTEKVLRPIAVGQPFIHLASYGSLAYLRRYGFKTFDSIIDESYDTIKNPESRMLAVIDVMKTIAAWSDSERHSKLEQIKHITEHNKKYFFSDDFFKLIIDELKNNLRTAFAEQEITNTGDVINWRKKLSRDPETYNKLTGRSPTSPSRADIATFVKKTREYYLKNKH